MGSCALVALVLAAVLAVVQCQDCSSDPRSGAFEYSEFCRPLRDRNGVRYGEVCADTKLNDNIVAEFPPSCMRLKFRADEGYQLNKLRGGGHFGEPPEKQDRFTSYRDIDSWKSVNGIVDPVTVARILICPEELAGMSECCGGTVNAVAYAVVSSIPDGEEIRAFLGANEDTDDLCTTREADNTTSCTVEIQCEACAGDQCRGLGGVCSAIGDFLCPAPRVPYLPEGDEFCACCGEDSCLDGFDCIALDDPVCPDASVLLNQDGACTCACVAEGTCFAETENVCVTYYAYGLLNCDGATEPFRDENGFCACGCTATDTCVLEGSTDCIKTADFNCSNSAEDPVRADDGTCSCEIQCPLGTCFVVNFACINAGGSCNNNSAGFSGFLGRGADGLICDCCNPATSCIDEQTDVCILLSEFPCSSPSDVAFANGANKGYCTCPS